MNELERYQNALTELSAEYVKTKTKLSRLKYAMDAYNALLEDASENEHSLRETRNFIIEELINRLNSY